MAIDAYDSFCYRWCLGRLSSTCSLIIMGSEMEFPAVIAWNTSSTAELFPLLALSRQEC